MHRQIKIKLLADVIVPYSLKVHPLKIQTTAQFFKFREFIFDQIKILKMHMVYHSYKQKFSWIVFHCQRGGYTLPNVHSPKKNKVN